ncbi:short chain dehydrogenase [Bimuria novae-zelandiae CBS 107.79]|uniref:Short chain dehydrogenase n=1 Tax=Bimuria novae-zelandiae CBS 107.79 TaxID=1447943 RepID=A0A6A5UU39_9PLEO|nr:short chain dehydrogenase [Bimuria novae-zelandiae CBS 107.79]
MPETEPHFHYWRTHIKSQWCFTPPDPTTQWTGKTVIVTGANIGLGLEAARHFARLGAEKVIIAARNMEAAQKAKASIELSTKCGPSVVECWSLDLCSYDAVKAFAARCTTLPRLDCLLENAGVSKYRFYKTPGALDELQITTNVVSTFLLALLVLPKLKETALKYDTQPHLTIVTSELHHQTTIPERKALRKGVHATLLDALNDPRTSSRSGRYPVSKLLQVLMLRELASTLGSDYPVVINCVNPGFCHSALTRDFAPIAYIGKIAMRARTTEVGSRTLVHAASAGRESYGEYLSNCQVALVGNFVRSKEGKQVQEMVWREVMERLEGIEPRISKNLR